MVYLPEEKLLVQSNIVNTNNPLPAMPTRDQQTLLTEVTRFEAGCRAGSADPWQADPVERLREDRPAADSQHRRRQLVSRLLHPRRPAHRRDRRRERQEEATGNTRSRRMEWPVVLAAVVGLLALRLPFLPHTMRGGYRVGAPCPARTESPCRPECPRRDHSEGDANRAYRLRRMYTSAGFFLKGSLCNREETKTEA